MAGDGLRQADDDDGDRPHDRSRSRAVRDNAPRDAVFLTPVDPRAAKLGGLFIGIAIVGDIIVGGPVTGAAMNPARWFGPAAASGDFSDAYVWTVGPILGAIIVALLYRFVFAPAREEGTA